jgi:hypothetical protein
LLSRIPNLAMCRPSERLASKRVKAADNILHFVGAATKRGHAMAPTTSEASLVVKYEPLWQLTPLDDLNSKICRSGIPKTKSGV